MSPFRSLLTAVSLSAALAATPAAALQPGKDHLVLSTTQAAPAKGQVEVVEFFWYKCPHCFHLEHEVSAWSGKLPKGTTLKRVPAVPAESWAPLARAYYSLETLGLLSKLHYPMFEALHKQGIDVNNPDIFFNWAAKQGANRSKLATAYRSFAVETKVKQAAQLTSQQLMLKKGGLFGQPEFVGVPTFVVNGKYLTSVSMTGTPTQLFATLDALIAREGRSSK